MRPGTAALNGDAILVTFLCVSGCLTIIHPGGHDLGVKDRVRIEMLLHDALRNIESEADFECHGA